MAKRKHKLDKIDAMPIQKQETDKLERVDSAQADAIRIVDVGVVRDQGARPHQEDRYQIVPVDLFSEDPSRRVAFFAVYDGHGGHETSEHVSDNLHSLIAQTPEFQEGDYKAAITAGLQEEDKLLQDELGHEKGGSTVALCLVDVREGRLVVANLGDSHVVLGQEDAESENGFKLSRLSNEHKPTSRKELARIKNAGGRVRRTSRGGRIGGINMSRALGDFRYKHPFNHALQSSDRRIQRAVDPDPANDVTDDFISITPHLKTLSLADSQRSILILASDGVAEKEEAEDLVGLAMRRSGEGRSAGEIAAEVVRGKTEGEVGCDNCTCVVVVIERA